MQMQDKFFEFSVVFLSWEIATVKRLPEIQIEYKLGTVESIPEPLLRVQEVGIFAGAP